VTEWSLTVCNAKISTFCGTYSKIDELDTKMIHLSCWPQRWSVTLRIFASVVQLYTHSIDEATNSPALADGLAHGITGQTTNNDDYERELADKECHGVPCGNN
jgi:hypothetical protein